MSLITRTSLSGLPKHVGADRRKEIRNEERRATRPPLSCSVSTTSVDGSFFLAAAFLAGALWLLPRRRGLLAGAFLAAAFLQCLLTAAFAGALAAAFFAGAF